MSIRSAGVKDVLHCEQAMDKENLAKVYRYGHFVTFRAQLYICRAIARLVRGSQTRLIYESSLIVAT